MAIERGDWVRHADARLGLDGEVEEVRGEQAEVRISPKLTVKVPLSALRITTRPQTGQGRR
jgi:hypothetical protein